MVAHQKACDHRHGVTVRTKCNVVAKTDRETITFSARDGYELSGTLFVPIGKPRAGLLINSATGFRQSYYHHFAAYAASRGCIVLTFDCRGIGASAPDALRAFHMHYTDWGWHDMPAALDALAQKAPGLALIHVGHSVGGHFVGLWDNHDRVDAHAFVCAGSGYWRAHRLPSPIFELYFWHLYGPLMIRRHGYVPRGAGWRGTDLPRGLFEPWRRWCLSPDYFDSEVRSDPHFSGHHYELISKPIDSYVYTDDPIATPKTAQAILDLYPSAQRTLLVREPNDHGVKSIGHNGPFQPRHRPAQKEILETLAARVDIELEEV